MPELPEVEAARRALQEHCVGKRIVRCAAADDAKVIDGVARDRLESALVGRAITAARRKGKNLWLELDSPPHPTFQFGPSPLSSAPPNYFRWVSFPFLSALDRFLVLRSYLVVDQQPKAPLVISDFILPFYFPIFQFDFLYPCCSWMQL
jgi:formamidopyrimidine-DNA glycosylase